MPGDRRIGPRVALNNRALVLLQDGRFRCTTLNLAANGLGLRSPVPSTLKRGMRVLFYLPDGGGWVRTDAVLVREQQRGGDRIWGLELKVPDGRTSKRIERYVTHLQNAVRRARAARWKKATGRS